MKTDDEMRADFEKIWNDLNYEPEGTSVCWCDEVFTAYYFYLEGRKQREKELAATITTYQPENGSRTSNQWEDRLKGDPILPYY